MVGDAADQLVQVLAVVVPLERRSGEVVAVLEAEDAFGEVVQVAEVAGLDRFALQDREVDLDLVEPRGVDR